MSTQNEFERCRFSADLNQRTEHVLLRNQPSSPVMPHSVEPAQGITEKEAVTLALWNNPAYEALLSDLGLSFADVLEASQVTNPDFSILFPLGPKQLEFAVNVPIDSFLLRPARMELAVLRSKEVGNRVLQDSLNFVRDVRFAHSELLLAQDVLKNAEDRYDLLERINGISEARLTAGTAGELDVMTTRIELQAAAERRDRAGYDLQVAQERLRTLMGMAFCDIPIVAMEDAEPIYIASDRDALVTLALKSRPDVWAANYAHQAACEQMELVRWNFISTTGIVSGKQNAQQIGPGLAMTLPVFHCNRASKCRAYEDWQKTRNQWEAVRQQVAWDVRTAYVRMEQAETSWLHWNDEMIPAAEEAVATSEKAYRAGGDYLLLTLLNSQQLLDAELKKAEASAELRNAISELERSVGKVVVKGRNEMLMDHAMQQMTTLTRTSPMIQMNRPMHQTLAFASRYETYVDHPSEFLDDSQEFSEFPSQFLDYPARYGRYSVQYPAQYMEYPTPSMTTLRRSSYWIQMNAPLPQPQSETPIIRVLQQQPMNDE